MNVLLVDDEEYVLDYLQESVEWNQCGIAKVYRASSVDEALDIVKKYPVPLLLTDIRMPEKSGLDLLETLHSQSPETKVIVLSGYSEFEYAKKAIQHGAADYLLKPVTGGEVTACIRKVTDRILAENKRLQDVNKAEAVIRLGNTRMREHLLLDLLLGKSFAEDELRRQMDALRLPLHPIDDCTLLLIRLQMSPIETREDIELFTYALLNMAEEIFFREIHAGSSLWWCKDSHQFIALVLPADSLGERKLWEVRISELQQAAKTFLKRNISVLFTERFPLRTHVNRFYLQALNDFWWRIGIQDGVILHNGSLSSKPEYKPLAKLYEEPSILQCMEANRWEEVVEKIGMILEELGKPPYRTQYHIVEVVNYLYACFTFMANKQGDSLTDLIGNFSLISNPYYFHSGEQIRDWVLPLIDQFRRTLTDTTSGRSHIIRQIHEFIQLHLHEDVSLTKVGEHVYLHPVYLSRLYKKETGDSLSAYITRVRMEKAARLLTQTNKKVSDIAQEVGYQKTQYFIKLFKEYYHCTPQSYRNP
ncbi:response regulator [Paenibacillus sedimenti]|uniref:Response regulator n=1 Tax=Paenibacillus sedimenti TaxID=2770274 RepID=A0A926QNJ0_9BACL|nr:response regulator [Paenibacillus sedimenti]MBD0384429.1 response regulator [Paenibacillus sedimenti]